MKLSLKIKNILLITSIFLFTICFLYIGCVSESINCNTEVYSVLETDELKQIEIESNNYYKQKYVNSLNNINQVFLYLNNDQLLDVNVEIQVLDNKDKVLKNIRVNNLNENVVVLDLSDLTIYYDSEFYLSITNLSNSTLLLSAVDNPVYVQTKNNGLDTVNINELNLVTNMNGVLVSYHTNIILISLFVILLLIAILYKINRNQEKIRNVREKLFGILNKFKLCYVFEAILFFIVILMLMGNIVNLYFYSNINIIFYFINLLLAIIFIVYFMELLMWAKGCVERYYLIITIPVSLAYLFFMVPNSVPDEFVHFTKTYATSSFNFGIPSEVNIPSSMQTLSRYNYLTYWNGIFSHTDYSNLVVAPTCGNNFILYLIPSFGIMVGRLINFSILGSYLLARFFNFILFASIGYFSIKKIPYGKLLLLVYLLSPMIVQQGMSLSVDLIINAICILSISYMLNIYASYEDIRNKDILILSICFILITISKYIYLPIFGLLFLSFKKLKKLNIKQWLFVFSIIIFTIGFYYYFNIYLNSISGNEYALDYKIVNEVNESEQLKLVFSNLLYFPRVIIYTLKVYAQFYLSGTFVYPLSWLNLNLDINILYVFLTVIGIAILSEEYRFNFKKHQKIWMIFLSVIMIAAVFLALYITWSPVGGELILGIQGRYFIPPVILLLFIFGGKKKLYLKNNNLVIISFLLIIHCYTIMSIIDFFKIINL